MCETFEHIDLGDIARKYLLELLAGHEDEYGPLIVYLKGADAMMPLPGRLSREECFVLHNGAVVSYGDILGLAGDYYLEWTELDNAVLDPTNHNVTSKAGEVHDILVAAHDTLNHKVLTAEEIAKDAQREDPGEKYLWARVGLPMGRSTALAKKNQTHFPPDGFAAWQKFHELAISMARRGRSQQTKHVKLAPAQLDPTIQAPVYAELQTPAINGLIQAIKICAFGDHFLTDMFSAGHMRTPRARLQQDFNAGKPVTVNDVISRLQHQEDGNHGLFCEFFFGPQKVNGQRITSWYAMGDKHFADPRNALNKSICVDAIKRSIRDVVLASFTGKYPTEVDGYWRDDPAPHASHAALQLIPRPLPPSDKYVASLGERQPTKANSWPIAMPQAGYDKRNDGFLKLLGGRDKGYLDGQLQFRKQLGTPVGSTSHDYIDLAAKLKELGGGELEYVALIKLLYQHGNDYQPEGV